MKPLFSAYSQSPRAVDIINSKSIANSYESKTLVSKPKFSTQKGFISTKPILNGSETQKEE